MDLLQVMDQGELTQLHSHVPAAEVMARGCIKTLHSKYISKVFSLPVLWAWGGHEGQNGYSHI